MLPEDQILGDRKEKNPNLLTSFLDHISFDFIVLSYRFVFRRYLGHSHKTKLFSIIGLQLPQNQMNLLPEMSNVLVKRCKCTAHRVDSLEIIDFTKNVPFVCCYKIFLSYTPYVCQFDHFISFHFTYISEYLNICVQRPNI